MSHQYTQQITMYTKSCDIFRWATALQNEVCCLNQHKHMYVTTAWLREWRLLSWAKHSSSRTAFFLRLVVMRTLQHM